MALKKLQKAKTKLSEDKVVSLSDYVKYTLIFLSTCNYVIPFTLNSQTTVTDKSGKGKGVIYK